MYSVKEIYYTLQGEGYHTGRPSIFLRFSGCNLWTGLENDRKKALCNWCDTDFVGTDGANGGKYTAKQILESHTKIMAKIYRFKTIYRFHWRRAITSGRQENHINRT